MSLDLNRVSGLLHIIEKAAGHPGKYTGLEAMARRDLASLEVDAKKEHEELLKKEAKEAAEAKAKVDAEAKKIADEDAKKLEAMAAPKPVARPAASFEKPEAPYVPPMRQPERENV